jgi:uncharacterized protein YgfB (UPF0149 family)
MSDPQIPDFDDVERMLVAAGAAWEAAESHGSFCGMACLKGAAAIADWNRELLLEAGSDDVLARERIQQLQQLVAKAILELEAGDMSFELLLPADDEPLRQRTAALADWCHGFMHGLALAGGADQGAKADRLDDAIPSEILDDFSEITKAGADNGEGEESEQAFVELVEYVRVSTQLIYDETKALRPSASKH